jgi:hypothetical protein
LQKIFKSNTLTTIKLIEIQTPDELKEFVAFQYFLYKESKYWVPPLIIDELKSLNKKKNPAFDFCKAKYWLAYKAEIPVGRIAAIINCKYNEKWNRRAIRFGWFDFIDDFDVSRTLLNVVENWAHEEGMNFIHGPLGFTDLDGAGALIEGFEELSTFGAIYNYPYYPAHFESAGYRKDTDWVEYQFVHGPVLIEKLRKISEIALKRNDLHVLKARKAKELLPYAKQVFELINIAYKDLYGFVELSDKQINMYVNQYFDFIIPEFIPIILDSKNRVAAFGIAMPSLSEAFRKCYGRLLPFGFISILRAMKKNTKADLYLTAVRPDLQNKGVNAVLIHETNKAFIKRNITTVETNRELENNLKVQSQWKFFDTRLHKRRRCYQKALNSSVLD